MAQLDGDELGIRTTAPDAGAGYRRTAMRRTQIAMRMPAITLNSYCGLGSEDLPELHLMERLLV
jgi:hypothetical protein